MQISLVERFHNVWNFASQVDAPTLHRRMLETGGRSTGFDYLRIVLAISVIVWHAFPLSYGSSAEAIKNSAIWSQLLVGLALPMFFALSGFLVAGSLERNPSIVTFLGLRAIRIAPALTVEVILSALLLGPLLTTLTLGEYFRDPLFYRYLLNIVGHIQYHLPGLFLTNPLPSVVNGQLWTVPWELKCYIALTFLAMFGLVRKRCGFLLITVLSALVLWACYVTGVYVRAGTPLLTAFLVGVLLYRYKDVVRWSASFALIAAILWMVLSSFDLGIFGAFPATYLTVYLGLTNAPKIAVLRGADYSYGLYLYGFVIQQAVANIFPWSHHWYLNLAITLPIAAAFAALSWHCVEKPALKLRAVLTWLESKPWIQRKAGLATTSDVQS